MKAAPTLDGRVRIDPETDLDLLVLRAVLPDARARKDGLAERVAGEMAEEVEEDWREYVTPDLQETFDGQLVVLAEAVSSAEVGEPIFIEREQAEAWYGALNQARLSLEDRYGFGDEELDDMEPEMRTARIRSHFYQILQGLLLEFLISE